MQVVLHNGRKTAVVLPTTVFYVLQHYLLYQTSHFTNKAVVCFTMFLLAVYKQDFLYILDDTAIFYKNSGQIFLAKWFLPLVLFCYSFTQQVVFATRQLQGAH